MDSSGKILLTTSRNPTPSIRTFCKDLMHVIPNLVSVNRGKMSADEVAEKAVELDADRVVVVDRWRGGPGIIKFFRVGGSGLVSTSSIIHVAGIKLQREFGISRVKPAVALVLSASKASGEVLRVAEALSEFLGMPMLSVAEAVKTGPTLMCVSSDKGNRIVVTFTVEPDHVEVGPQIIVSKMEW